ncbi:uncharacterized protein DUF4185 [Salana multivorans]|uniref:Uncharacterized protein DUF4185 n=1 Tax=Salana multivorans TaxID=120377 RepID=A0A3N2DAU4_9MICO|nr:DUF4185 domain-containing protein [Salana multivorans]OJX95409.1 MAG: hypothetical protein BGO96_11280 [Micrococcales bacterium 73-15]ROR96564.1 uncharacterized protein DUF4185 [Salana multivorans]
MTPDVSVVDGVPVARDRSPLLLRVAHVDQAASVLTESDGDLWPAAWADDDALYTACGDGTGFARHDWRDIVVNRVTGTPREGLRGERLSAGDAVAPAWDPERFNRKPTGMVAVDGDGDGRDELYLAVQDLRCGAGPDTFNEAPTATVCRSDDRGLTWTWPAQPLFTDHVFTTVMFLDLGRSNGGSEWVYAYGIDGNWRTSFSHVVPDPTQLFLARVRADAIQDRAAWEFVAGTEPDGADGGLRPVWSSDVARRVPVLEDTRRFYPTPALGFSACDFTCIAQGGVVWNAGLGRYLYSTWSEYTFEFFEAPAPWGPWRLLHSHDFGHFPWHGPRSPLAKHGGYAPTMPSRFISDDGREMWLQSNWFVPASSRGGRAYCFGLRRVRFDPGTGQEPPRPTAPSENLARSADASVLVPRVREGGEHVLNDGRRDVAEDSAYGPGSGEDVWGIEWPSPRWFDRVVYVPGPQDSLGGWFASSPRVEVRRDGVWHEVAATVTPPYPTDWTALEEDEYVFDLDAQCADAVRIAGEPGGGMRYTSIRELEVWFRGAS